MSATQVDVAQVVSESEVGPSVAERTRRRSVFSGRPLTVAERILVAVTIGAVAACFTWISTHPAPDVLAKDFTYPWRAARALLAGQNPYDVIRPAGRYPLESFFPYPPPAAIVAVPFAGLGPDWAATLFFGLCSAVLAFAYVRDGLWRLWAFLGASFFLASWLAQWSPLLMAGVLLPSFAWALAIKPTLGAALFAYRPTWRAVIGGVVLLLASFIVVPTWPRDWITAVTAHHTASHRAPVMLPFGWLALVALLRWRKPEARLVAALACVPQNPYFYDQLLLWLVPWNGITTFLLSACSWVAWYLATSRCANPHFCGREAEPWIVALLYVPAAIMAVLRPEKPRPSGDGPEPA